MTKLEAVRSITGAKEFSKIVFELVERAGTPEELEKNLCTELTEEGLTTLRSVAQHGNYPLSFDARL